VLGRKVSVRSRPAEPREGLAAAVAVGVARLTTAKPVPRTGTAERLTTFKQAATHPLGWLRDFRVAVTQGFQAGCIVLWRLPPPLPRLLGATPRRCSSCSSCIASWPHGGRLGFGLECWKDFCGHDGGAIFLSSGHVCVLPRRQQPLAPSAHRARVGSVQLQCMASVGACAPPVPAGGRRPAKKSRSRWWAWALGRLAGRSVGAAAPSTPSFPCRASRRNSPARRSWLH
jgi:hypothetical protein